MHTIYKIIGGGQTVRQNSQLGKSIEVVKVENSNLVSLAQCHGQNNFTCDLWSTDLSDVKKWANEWANKKVRLKYS